MALGEERIALNVMCHRQFVSAEAVKLALPLQP
jgi:hypothetical protein